MLHVALRGLFTRKLRSVLSAIAIVLGVSMISGTYVLTDTINNSFNNLFQEIYEGTDVVVSRHSTISGQEQIPPAFPQSVLAKVMSAPGVEAADGGVQGFASIVDEEGEIVGTHGAPNLGFSVNPRIPQFNTLTLVSGSWPQANEVVIDQSAADKGDFQAGDMIGILGSGPVEKMRLSGIVRFGSSNGILGATLAGFDLPTAQRVFGKKGKLDYIQVAAQPGVTPEQLAADVRAAVPDNYDVKTAEAQIDEQSSDTSAGISVFRTILLAFGAIALFVGAFVIVNSLSITIAQRTREFATLRTLGASRAQVLGSIVVESLVVSLLASVVGLFSGFGIAVGLMKLFESAGLELPANALSIEPRTIVVSLVVGVVVTVVASLFPAFRATRVPPIAAVREGAKLPPSRFHGLRTPVSIVLIWIGFSALLYGLFRDELTTNRILLSIGVGALLIFIGVALVSARLVTPLAKTASPVGTWAVVLLAILVWPLNILFWSIKRAARRRDEFPNPLPDMKMNRLALHNSRRNTQRTASTAAALMIGLALATLVAVLAASIITSFKGAVDDMFTGDYVVEPAGGQFTFSRAASDAISTASGFEAAANIRVGAARIFGSQTDINAIEGRASKVLKLDWKAGSQRVLDNLDANEVIVDSDYAESHHLKLGSPVPLVTPTGQTLHLKVAGIFEPPPGGSPFFPVTLTARTFDKSFENPQNEFSLVKMRGGDTPENSKALENALKDFPNARSQTRQEWVDSLINELNQVLMILYVLLAFSVLISFFGIVNTLVLTVFERTRELGMLRAVGMTRRQARRMIRQESVITSLIGAFLGIALGLVFGALLVGRIEEFEFAVPTAQLILFAIAAVIVGVVAAILPARRAARLNVLEALQYE